MKTSICFNVFFILLLFALLNTCKKDDKIVKDKITGYIQKGPYINGTTIDIFELNPSLNQTGNVFSTSINNNMGSFEINNIELSSHFVEFKALGFYFNELTGEKSSAQFALNALSDLSDNSTVNVNILTHLEESRVRYLVNDGIPFSAAKALAQADVLAIFGIDKKNMNKSEMLDISLNNEDNAILLAISVIIQGDLSVADLTETLANISNDIKEDGILNNEKIKAYLYNTAQNLDLAKVRENLQKRYDEIGMTVSIPDIDEQVYEYIASKKPFEIKDSITDVKCHGEKTGKINLTINGGTPPFTFAWSNKATTENLEGVPYGSYSVTVTDANKYILTKKNMYISRPNKIYIKGVISNETCESNDGAIDVAVTGGVQPYLYSWSNGETGQDLSNIKSGNYTITVTDANQCIKSADFFVTKNTGDIHISGIVTNTSSSISTDGAIDITISGGTQPYQYTWSNNETTEDLYNISEGRYTITVTDGIGCSSSHVFNLTSIIYDIDGNEYKTIAFGSQVWMAENLKVTKYNDGTEISNITDDIEWTQLITPAYCWYNNDYATYGSVYGALYNGYVISSVANDGKNVCPAGWHVPADAEWTTLTNNLGGANVAGGKLKETGTTHWISPNEGATNEIGFTVLPGGYRGGNGPFYGNSADGAFWSVTNYDNNILWNRNMRFNTSEVIRNIDSKQSGYSVRCVRN